MRKIRILHILQSDRFSGAENVVCQIIEIFKDSEIEMAYCSREGQIRETLEKRNIQYFPMVKLSINEIRRVVKEYRPDIIHAHDFTASMLCTFSVSVPIISHLHNNAPWIKKYGVKSFAFLLTCFRYKRILIVSDSIVNEYVFGSLINKKTVTIGNPIDTSIIRRKSGLKKSGKCYDIAFMGRLAAPKNPIRFIKLVQKLLPKKPDIKVIMIGDGKLRLECEQLIEELKLQETITMLGFQENPFPIISRSKLLCMTSEWEGFGLAAVEAMTLGVPVVCANVGGLKQIINSQCGMLCDNDYEFVVELYKLLTNSKYLQDKSIEAIMQSKNFDNLFKYRETLRKEYLDGCYGDLLM